MKSKFSILHSLTMFLGVLFVALYAFAEDGVTAPQDFLAQVLEAIKVMGGLPVIGKVAAVLTLVVASMKVSFLNQLLWSKLGAAKVYVAPLLGLIAGVLGLGMTGPVTGASVFAYVIAGAGAVYLHEILDSVKAIPGIGALYVAIIGIIQGALGGPKPAPKA